jgi:hypothetical protein
MVVGYYPMQIYRIALRLRLTALHPQILHDPLTPVQTLPCSVLALIGIGGGSRWYWSPTGRKESASVRLILLFPLPTRVGTERQEDHAHGPGS